MKRILHNLGVKCGTNKTDIACTWLGKSYLDYYETHFTNIKNLPLNILELGVKNGQSLNLWKSYFTKSRIFGLDIDPNCKQYEDENVYIEIGSQDDSVAISNLVKKCDAPFDIIIDDASHINTLIIASYNLLFPHLKSKGMYIIEDLRNCYDDLTGVETHWPGMSLTKDLNVDFKNDRNIINNFFFELIKNMDYHRGQVETIFFYPMIAIINKI